MVIPQRVRNLDTAAFCGLLKITPTDFAERLAAAKSYSYVKPSIFYKQISNEEFAAMEGMLDQYKGFYIQPRTVRAYSYPAASNALGYISEISKRELNQDSVNYYQQGDYIGKSGLESFYEPYLRGRRGKKFKIRNVRGVEQGKFKEGRFDTLAIPGQTLKSTIDLELQLYGEKLMAGKSGSVIALEPSSGEILSFVSAPGYDPGLLSGRLFSENFEEISSDTNKPLFNRPLMATYRPGSIFKIAQSLAAMQEGLINRNTRLKCNTALIGCHNGASHPFGTSENLVGAIKHSCNPYFYQVMRSMVQQGVDEDPYKDSHIGLDKWRGYIGRFGFGSPLPVKSVDREIVRHSKRSIFDHFPATHHCG
jgi:penicillin-binding protein 2